MMNGNLDHKTKMISLRLSAVEFDFLRNRYQSYGARNVSDLARLAVQRMMSGLGNADNSMAAKIALVAESVADLDNRIATLESQVAFLVSGKQSHHRAAQDRIDVAQEEL